MSHLQITQNHPESKIIDSERLQVFLKIFLLGWSLIGVFAFFLDYFWIYSASAVAVIFFAPLFYALNRNPTTYDIAEVVAIFYIIYMPCLSLYYYGETQHMLILMIILLVFGVVPKSWRMMSAPMFLLNDMSWSKSVVVALLVLMIFLVIASPVGDYTSIAFYILLAISLIFLELSLASGASRAFAYRSLVGYAALMFFYSLFLWNGFGRLFFGILVTMVISLYHHYGIVKIKNYYLIFGAPAFLLLGHYLRDGFEHGLRLHEGSVGSPIFNSSDLVANIGSLQSSGFSGFFDQVLLFFFIWIPRTIWSEKPIGLGSSLVDDYLGRTGLSEFHSTAPGMIGEAVWFFSGNFAIGLLLTVLVIFFTRFLIKRLALFSVVPVIIFDAFIGNIFWGGLASASARIWFLVFPALISVVILYKMIFHDNSFAFSESAE